jgi:hypothetical protein
MDHPHQHDDLRNNILHSSFPAHFLCLVFLYPAYSITERKYPCSLAFLLKNQKKAKHCTGPQQQSD